MKKSLWGFTDFRVGCSVWEGDCVSVLSLENQTGLKEIQLNGNLIFQRTLSYYHLPRFGGQMTGWNLWIKCWHNLFFQAGRLNVTLLSAAFPLHRCRDFRQTLCWQSSWCSLIFKPNLTSVFHYTEENLWMTNYIQPSFKHWYSVMVFTAALNSTRRLLSKWNRAGVGFNIFLTFPGPVQMFNVQVDDSCCC